MKKYSDTDEPEFLILHISAFLAMTIPTRYFVKKYKSPVPYNLFLVVFGIIIACAAFHLGYTYDYRHIPPFTLLSIFIPFFTVATMYNMDFYVFIRSLPQTIIISWLGASLNILMLGMFFKHILHAKASYPIAFLAALTFVPIQPSYIIVIFKELSQYNYLSTFLEAETILSSIPILMLFNIGLHVLEHDDISFSHVTIMLIKFIFGGVTIGIIVGKSTSLLMCWLYSEPYSALCVSVGMIMIAYFLSEYIFEANGLLALFCIMSFISLDKHKFSSEVDNCFRVFWRNTSYLIQAVTIMFATFVIIKHEYDHFNLIYVYGTLIAYFTANIVRIISFLLMKVILDKMMYEMNVRNLVILGWSGVKGCLNLLMALALVHTGKFENDQACVLVDILVFMLLSLLINSSSMRMTLHLFGFSDSSNIRKTNLTNCIKFIMDKRSSAIKILKQDRYLTQANWSVVRLETTMEYPKLKKLDDDEEDLVNIDENEDFLWNIGRTLCTVCQSELPFELSEKELVVLMREGQMKILKAKKVSVIRQYESGNIDKNCMQVLVHMYDLMIESNQKTSSVNLKSYFRRNVWLDHMIFYLHKLMENTIPERPQSQMGRLCYYTMLHFTYDYILFGIVVLYCASLIHYTVIGMCVVYDLSILIHVLFTLDFFIKIIGYSARKSICNLTNYIRYKWNIFDLVFLLIGYLDVICTYHKKIRKHQYLVIALKWMCFLRIFKFFQIIQPLYGKVLKIIEYRLDSRTCIGYDLATALDKCTDEILSVIHQLIGSKFIIDLYKKHLMDEKQSLIKQLEYVQKERPWIAITVKTKQAIRTTLNSMENALNELKVTGFVDNIEYSFIWKEILKAQKVLRNMKFIQPSSRMVIFYEVPWIALNKDCGDFLYRQAQFISWEAGDLICREGSMPHGIYIVVDGMLRMYYIPRSQTLNQLREFGSIPIVDHISTLRLEGKMEINICPGDTMGELSILTDKPYDCSVYAESHGEAFVLLPSVISAAMERDNNPIMGLEARMWKSSLIDLAVSILMEIPLYQSFTPEQIKFKLQSAFVPNLRCYKMFVITETMDEVLLMEGIVADYHSNHTFVAPMLIPRTVQKIILPTASLVDVTITTKLLILPTVDADACEIMEYEQEIAELVSVPSETCLVHTVRTTNNQFRDSTKFKKSFAKFR